MSIHAPRVPALADAIVRASEDLDHVEAMLRSSKRNRPDGAVADRILTPLEQRFLELIADVETQLWTSGPAPRRASEEAVAAESDSPPGAGFHERIAVIDGDVARLRAIATHPSAHDNLGWAAAALFDASRWLVGDLNLEAVERVECALERAAWRVRAVQEAVDRFGPGAIVEVVERPRSRR
jgi:hypothetical protein